MPHIGSGERLLIVGPPGSGKSNFTAYMLEGVPSVVVIDSKQDPREWARWGPAHGYVVTEDPDDIARHARVIFRPDQRALMDIAGWSRPDRKGWEWTTALQRIFKRGRTVTVFDETVQTLPATHPHPDAMRLYTQGRSFELPCWAGTQVANRIETLTARLAEHCFGFGMSAKEAKLLCDARGVSPDALVQLALDREAGRPFRIAYHRMGRLEWQLLPPVPLVPGWGAGGAPAKPAGELEDQVPDHPTDPAYGTPEAAGGPRR